MYFYFVYPQDLTFISLYVLSSYLAICTYYLLSNLTADLSKWKPDSDSDSSPSREKLTRMRWLILKLKS